MDLILYYTDITISRYGHVDLTRTTTNPEGSVFTVLNVLVTPASRGAIRLSSADPLSLPLLDPAAFQKFH
jgi:hypothetical protein